MEEDTEYLKLPIEERCVHKLWKARLNGYEAATKLFNQIDDEKSPQWNVYSSLIKKFVVDSNAVAQEKGLEAVLTFVENAKIASKNPSEVIAGVVAKCLGAPKAKTKELGIDILLMYVEIERQEPVLEELIKGFDQKNPKAVLGCIHACTCIVKEFGPKVLSLKPLLKQIPKILDHRDGSVREEGKALCIELYRWIGVALKPQMQDLKPIQVTELEGWFEKVSGDRPQRARYLRSEQEKISKAKEAGDAHDGAVEREVVGDAEAPIDPYDLLDPVDILSKLPKDFYEKAEAKKWQERKEALETLLELVTKNPKLEPGDYGDLIKLLKKVIAKDTNVMLVALGAQCLTGIAKGLKKKFHPYAASCLSVILEKFKEKKTIVVTSLRDAIDSVGAVLSFEVIQEDISGALENKNPSIKAETASYLARAFASSSTTSLANKKILKAYITPLLKALNESDPLVRDNAAEALGALLKIAGEKLVMPFMTDVDPLKMAKVKECADKVEVKGKPSQVSVVSSSSSTTVASIKSSAPRVVAVSKPEEEFPSASSSSVKKPSSGVSAPGLKKAPVKKKAPTATKAGSGKGNAGVNDESQYSEKELALEEAEALLEELLPEDIRKGIADGNWKTRLSALENVGRIISCSDAATLPAQALIKILCKKPGLKDNNFQVLKLRFEAIKSIAGGSKVSRTSAIMVIPDLTDKLGDAKSGPAACEALTAVAESRMTGGLSWVGSEVLKHSLSQKNPKVQADALNWLSQAVKEFGFNLPVKQAVDSVKGALGASNPAVRMAAVGFIGTLYLYLGKTLRTFFDDEKPQVVALIDEEFKKLEGLGPPAPFRGHIPVPAGDESDAAASRVESAQEINPEDLIPRVDIEDQISPALIEKLSDKNWKVRTEGLAEVKDIIGKAKFITPNLGELPSALKSRVGDLNKNLMMEAIGICKQLADSMGPKGKQHARIIIPAVIGALGDSKPHVRLAAKECLDTWEEKIKIHGIFEGEMIAESLKADNPTLRAELLAWLKAKIPEDVPVKGLAKDDVNACLPYLFSCLEDRNPDVRKNAQEVFFNFMLQVGVDGMNRAASKVKASSKTVIVALIEKHKGSMPVKVVPPPPVAETKAIRGGSGKPKPQAKPVEPPPEDDVDDEPCSKPTSASKPKPGSKINVRQRAGASKPTVVRKKGDDVDTSPLLTVNDLKLARFADEAKLKVLKWNFNTPREEFVEQLKEQLSNAGTNQSLLAQMFSTDFKLHIKALESLMEMTKSTAAVISNLDLLLKWLTLRFFETNPSVILKGLDFVLAIFDELAIEGYSMHDLEISCFVPYLIAKVGDPKEPVRNSAKKIIEKIPTMYSAVRLFPFLMEGLKSKNSRQRAECLEEMSLMIGDHSLRVCGATPAVALKEIAKQIADRDNSVRNAALNAVVQAYFQAGEKIYRMVGALAEKDMSMLEERIKRAQKTRPAVGDATICMDNRGAVPNLASPTSDLNATRSVTHRSGGGGKTRPQSAIFPSHQSPTSPNAHAREEKHMSPPPGVGKKVSRFGELGDFKLGPIEMRRDKLYPDLAEVPDLGMDMSMSMEVQTATKHFLGAGNGGSFAAGTATTLTSKTAAISSGTATVNSLLRDMSSSDAETCRAALCGMLMIVRSRESHRDVLPLIRQIVLSVKILGERYLASEAPFHRNLDEKFRSDYIHNVVELAFLFSLSEELLSAISEPLYLDFMRCMLMIMVDPRIAENKDTMRYLNKFFAHAVNQSDPTVCLQCTLTLFREFGNGAIIEGDKRSQTLMDIVMRLLWKIFQAMPNMISRYDCDPILREIDLYYRTFPRNYWADKEKKDRLPIKTVLTLLTTLCKERLSSVLTCLRQHPEYRSTEMGRIIEKFEKERQKKFSAGDANVGMDDGSRTLSRAAHNELTRIFQKIGDKEESNEGLRLLHAFRERHPEADLEPFLVKSSIFFKQYIEDGLGKLDEEKRLTSCEQAGAMSGDDLLSPLDPSLAEGGDVEDPALYFAKIKNLRARLGLKSSPLAENGASSANNDSPTDEQRGVNSGRRSNSSSDKSESAGGLSRESPGDENREILAPMTREEPVQPTVPENIDSIMRRFQLIKRGELK